MPILTSFDAEQKRVTQITRINKMTALEQRSAIKFCVANEKSRQETFKTAFGNNAMKKTALYKWCSKFEQGDTSVTGKPRPGRLSSISTKKIETVKELLDSDYQVTITDITIRTRNTFGTVFRIIHNELGMTCMRRICARWIPHMIDENRPGMLQTAILHHDNAPSHRSAQTRETIKDSALNF